jgi:hypothetical protein
MAPPHYITISLSFLSCTELAVVAITSDHCVTNYYEKRERDKLIWTEREREGEGEDCMPTGHACYNH